MLSSQLRQSLMALSVLSHGGGDNGLALTTRLSSCGFSCSFSPPFYQPWICCQLCTVHRRRPVHLSVLIRGRLEKIPLKHSQVWRYQPKREITVVTFNFFNYCSVVFWSERLRNTRLKCTTVLVNSVILTKIGFLKNHVNWFIVPACVELDGVLSCREADNPRLREADLSFTLPLHSLKEKNQLMNWALTLT